MAAFTGCMRSSKRGSRRDKLADSWLWTRSETMWGVFCKSLFVFAPPAKRHGRNVLWPPGRSGSMHPSAELTPFHVYCERLWTAAERGEPSGPTRPLRSEPERKPRSGKCETSSQVGY